MRYLFITYLLISYKSFASQFNDKLINKYDISKDDISYFIIDTETEKIIDSLNEKKPMTLASVSKIFTTYFALSTLGADYQFETQIGINGKIEDGTLKGDLVLIGSGAPYLTAQNLISLIGFIKKKNIKKITGNFFLDDSSLSFSEKVSNLGLEDQPDNPSMSALNVEFNRFKVYNQSISHPPLDHIQINKKISHSFGQKFKNDNSKKSIEAWILNPNENIQLWEELPTRNSTLFTGYFFKYLAQLHGLSLPPPQIGTLKKPIIIASTKGLNLDKLASLSFEYSNNLIAESLLQTAAKKIRNQKVSTIESARIMQQWLKNNFSNLNWDTTSFENGSGLTLSNRVSAEFLGNFLKTVELEKFDNSIFLSLFSINGHSGGIRNRLKDPNLAYRVYAKTGSLYYVNNIAGYLISNNGKKYAYAILITDSKNRNLLNQPNSDVNNKLRQKSSLWYNKATNLQDQILENWIKAY